MKTIDKRKRRRDTEGRSTKERERESGDNYVNELRMKKQGRK